MASSGNASRAASLPSPKKIVSFLASLKIAVVIILALAVSCGTATVLESLYDIPTARYWVYRAGWFHFLLALFGINILSVMVNRWPWKRKHLPFLFAHTGILLLLLGSWLTDRFGLDGSLRVSEGESTSIVEVDQPMIVVSEADQVYSYPVQWIPPSVVFHPYSLKDEGLPYDLRITGFMTHADPSFDFVPRSTPPPLLGMPSPAPEPALKFQLTGGPMRITQDFWLWTGDPSTQAFQAGPAWFELDGPVPNTPDHGPKLSFKAGKGFVAYRAESPTGEVVQGKVPLRAVKGYVIDPHWMGIQITLSSFVPDASVSTSYHPSRTQYGEEAPPSAIRVETGYGATYADAWLGMGSRALLRTSGRELEIGYYRKRLMLPFAVQLDHFTINRYQGTMNPASYSSSVTIVGGSPVSGGATATATAAPASAAMLPSFKRVISMNEPLEHDGITLYQSSYEDAQPRPVTSILSVNRDPGRRWKYLGSLLIVFGSILLFAMKYRRKRAPKPPPVTQKEVTA